MRMLEQDGTAAKQDGTDAQQDAALQAWYSIPQMGKPAPQG